MSASLVGSEMCIRDRCASQGVSGGAVAPQRSHSRRRHQSVGSGGAVAPPVRPRAATCEGG
eukprot:13086428-Alexandrium_andersonii.AAC.1